MHCLFQYTYSWKAQQGFKGSSSVVLYIVQTKASMKMSFQDTERRHQEAKIRVHTAKILSKYFLGYKIKKLSVYIKQTKLVRYSRCLAIKIDLHQPDNHPLHVHKYSDGKFIVKA